MANNMRAGRIRRMGRQAFVSGEDPNDFNPFIQPKENENTYQKMVREDRASLWLEGWNEAKGSDTHKESKTIFIIQDDWDNTIDLLRRVASAEKSTDIVTKARQLLKHFGEWS